MKIGESVKKIKLMDIVKAVYAIDYTAKNRNIEIDNVEFDSRKVKANTLFVPLTGGETDGHDYVKQAIKNGATAVLWSREQILAPTDQIACVFVDDTLEAMQQLAKYYRQVLNPIVIGITGSNGKTTTKDMTANALTAKYRVHKTQGNYNNEIGLPYTLLQMPEDTEVVVCEMGMSEFKEIELLSQIAQPDIAAITLIGESHLEYLGSRQGIAQAKMEILSGLKESGLFIYPANECLIRDNLASYGDRFNYLNFGFDSVDDVYATQLVEEADKTFFRTNLDPNIICRIPVMGAYNVSNALIALSIAKQLEVPIEQAIFQLAQFELTANRLEWLETKQGARLLNDAYNASPTSMKAVLKSFASVALAGKGHRIAVLGDIRELGSDSRNYHRSLKAAIDSDKISKVYLFGSEMKFLYEELKDIYPKDHLTYIESNHDLLVKRLESDITAEDILVIKSSFGVDLLKVVTALTGHETH